MTSSFPPLTFLGAGSMGGALIRGVVASGASVSGGITAVNRSRASAHALADLRGVSSLASSDDSNAIVRACAGAGVIVVGTKPAVMPELLAEISGHVPSDAVVVSIAAGIPTSVLESALGRFARVVRAMPNTAVAVRAGVTGMSAGRHATANDLALVRRLFETVGSVMEVDESVIDSVTAVSGSGPAYVFLLVEEFTVAAERLGFTSRDARLLAEQTFIGATALLSQTGEPPAELRRRVTSPGGTTERGLSVLRSAELSKIFTDAVRAARDRATELGGGSSESPARCRGR